ncbi:MAG: hypothetical protein CFE44_17035 [Burkholderiales bacterium PBB4]|nr:MAG: hypothetical protein CFE44_17035 [Burkholderiales bacterium PBB4]
MPLHDLPLDARPREKLLARGPAALRDTELLAILLRTGIQGKGVLQMAEELLRIKTDSGSRTMDAGFGGIAGLLNATPADLKRVKGLGPAKRAEIVAVLELARRAMAQQLKERTVFADPDTIKHYLQLHLAARSYEVFAVIFLDAQNRLLAMEEMFRDTLTQLSIALLRKTFWLVSMFHSYPVREPMPGRRRWSRGPAYGRAGFLCELRVRPNRRR